MHLQLVTLLALLSTAAALECCTGGDASCSAKCTTDGACMNTNGIRDCGKTTMCDMMAGGVDSCNGDICCCTTDKCNRGTDAPPAKTAATTAATSAAPAIGLECCVGSDASCSVTCTTHDACINNNGARNCWAKSGCKLAGGADSCKGGICCCTTDKCNWGQKMSATQWLVLILPAVALLFPALLN